MACTKMTCRIVKHFKQRFSVIKMKIQKFGTQIETSTRKSFLPVGCSKSGIKFLSSQGNKTFKAKPNKTSVTQKLFLSVGK
jgi:hypothetical protein